MAGEMKKSMSKEEQLASLASDVNSKRLAHQERIRKEHEALEKLEVLEKDLTWLVSHLKTSEQAGNCLSMAIKTAVDNGMPLTVLEEAGFDWRAFQASRGIQTDTEAESPDAKKPADKDPDPISDGSFHTPEPKEHSLGRPHKFPKIAHPGKIDFNFNFETPTKPGRSHGFRSSTTDPETPEKKPARRRELQQANSFKSPKKQDVDESPELFLGQIPRRISSSPDSLDLVWKTLLQAHNDIESLAVESGNEDTVLAGLPSPVRPTAKLVDLTIASPESDKCPNEGEVERQATKLAELVRDMGQLQQRQALWKFSSNTSGPKYDGRNSCHIDATSPSHLATTFQAFAELPMSSMIQKDIDTFRDRLRRGPYNRENGAQPDERFAAAYAWKNVAQWFKDLCVASIDVVWCQKCLHKLPRQVSYRHAILEYVDESIETSEKAPCKIETILRRYFKKDSSRHR
ncbi:uncharacterized protein J3D65DRAFT_672321 [Phyllosticta citribraziliensis]|uniref:Uncharacterized protein n=1 Tax=Phyllosticta citribraziliensis TaxID=989973 RepID=A0ABR1L3X3_9PEZI